jgi:hypothetical protein
MWQQARARTGNSEARLLILADCPSAGSWVQQLQQVPAAAAFATGIAVQASCEAGHMSWSHAAPAQPGGIFTSWYTQASSHGESPWSLLPDALPTPSSNPLPHPAQVRVFLCPCREGGWAGLSRCAGARPLLLGACMWRVWPRLRAAMRSDDEVAAMSSASRCHAWGVNLTTFQRGVPSCAWAARSTCPTYLSLAKVGLLGDVTGGRRTCCSRKCFPCSIRSTDEPPVALPTLNCIGCDSVRHAVAHEP